MTPNSLVINGYDAFAKWGVFLDENGLSALMTPAPRKEPIKNSSRLEHGSREIDPTPRYDARDVTLTFNLEASSATQFLARYSAFISEVMAVDKIRLRTRYQEGVIYTLRYVSCTQFAQYHRGLARFTVRFREPNPNERT